MKGFELSTARRTKCAVVACTAVLAAGQAHSQGLRLQPNGAQKPSAAIPLPPTAPTAPQPLPQVQRVQPAPTRRARVDEANGLLTITADDSSLNQILRDIARQTGIQIIGGVTDERVFGTYGPADLSTILAVLLNGTGSNMMLSGDRPGTPRLLTLTPRQGGVSSPSPQQVPDTDAPIPLRDLPPQETPRTAVNPIHLPQQINPAQPYTPPAAQSQTTPAADDTTTQQSPNGVKTPQQIYDQLMKLQSQQPKPPH